MLKYTNSIDLLNEHSKKNLLFVNGTSEKLFDVWNTSKIKVLEYYKKAKSGINADPIFFMSKSDMKKKAQKDLLGSVVADNYTAKKTYMDDAYFKYQLLTIPGFYTNVKKNKEVDNLYAVLNFKIIIDENDLGKLGNLEILPLKYEIVEGKIK